MKSASGEVVLRIPSAADADDIARLLNNKKIWDNLRDYIPFPYSRDDAVQFIKLCENQSPPNSFSIIYRDELSGVISIKPQSDIYRLSGEIGYWIGEPFWGKGIATQAVTLMVQYGFTKLKFERLFANAFSHNKASQKVLENCGFKKECIAQRAAIKNNQLIDEHRYAILKS